MELLSGFGKRGVELGLLTKPVGIVDTGFLSKYFILQEFSPKFTAGKNSITFNGSDLLKEGSEVLVECLDSAGEALYIESTSKTNLQYKESSAYILSIHVYLETSNGPGKLILYGTLKTGATVKWIGDVMIDKTQQNVSTVRFYSKPTLEVTPILSPIIAYIGDLNQNIEFSGSFYSYAVSPEKDTSKIANRNVSVDYRIFAKQMPADIDPTVSFNSQIVNSKIDLFVKTIQEPYSYKNTNVSFTSSINVKKVINRSTLILGNTVTYKDSKKNDVVVNIVDGDFLIKYPYILYNTASESSSYLVTNTTVGDPQIKQSFADITYRNLKTFSGFIARHKLYRKSLFSTGDFEVIADEPLIPYEILRDKLTTNKSFDLLGSFYNQRHIDKYWYSNGSNLELTQSSVRLNESLYINCPNIPYINLNSLNNYLIVKDNASKLNRDSKYIGYDSSEFLSISGSSYDSNFIALKKNVNYILSLNAIIKKDNSSLFENDAGLEFYFTSSITDINYEQNAVKNQTGLLKLGFVSAYEAIPEKIYDFTKILFTTSYDLFGTIIIVPRKCVAIISELSLKPYGDSGFSPDTLTTRIPFPISIANESFEIKAELFDVNSNLVYSDLRKITSFDPTGSTLLLYIPGLKDPNKTAYLSGSLEISQSLLVHRDTIITGSLTVSGSVNIANVEESSYTNERLLSWNPDTRKTNYTNINDISNYGTEEITMSLYTKGTSTLQTPFRVIPCVKGRNVVVLKN